MALSRAPYQFLRRIGALDETLSPAPRLDVSALKVNAYPVDGPGYPSQGELRGLEGATPPDRGRSVPWPDQDYLGEDAGASSSSE